MAYDLTKILQEYGDNDFGFTAVDEAEYNAVIAQKDETVEEYKSRLQQVEKIIMESKLFKIQVLILEVFLLHQL